MVNFQIQSFVYQTYNTHEYLLIKSEKIMATYL
jgi:hypothetical protein